MLTSLGLTRIFGSRYGHYRIIQETARRIQGHSWSIAGIVALNEFVAAHKHIFVSICERPVKVELIGKACSPSHLDRICDLIFVYRSHLRVSRF